ncbi:hypothetical protein Vadar_031792 [Vaccinium darrowii]|uniref:Uncharacterized protein n=1 Tax=Vaccinium darrowii TaxID=229202 RepID=A0ACB7YR96_9ERIC|nr:hypothetical protein Vadar_031792 [Vaccinium darrowii]
MQGHSLKRFEDTKSCGLIFSANAILEQGPLELDSTKAKGKIVVGITNGNGDEAHKAALALARVAVDAGGIGLILYMEGDGLPPCVTFPLPCAWFDNPNGVLIRKYLQKSPICAIGENLLVEGHKKDSYRLSDGTSSSTALVSGVVAYVRSSHPNWTPSAIKSAIMTTGVGLGLA